MGFLLKTRGEQLIRWLGWDRDGRVSYVENVWKWNKENGGMFVEIFKILKTIINQNNFISILKLLKVNIDSLKNIFCNLWKWKQIKEMKNNVILVIKYHLRHSLYFVYDLK